MVSNSSPAISVHLDTTGAIELVEASREPGGGEEKTRTAVGGRKPVVARLEVSLLSFSAKDKASAERTG